jgi:very-short-patch-repair endonuclease
MQNPLESIYLSLDNHESQYGKPPSGLIWMLVTPLEQRTILKRRAKKAKKYLREQTRNAPLKIFSDGKVSFEFKKQLSAKMTKNPTQAEAAMRKALLDNKIPFLQQAIICGYIPDFYIKGTHTIIEVDGGIHSIRKEQDAQRDKVFLENGIRTLRFSNDRVLKDIQSVISEIKLHMGGLCHTRINTTRK